MLLNLQFMMFSIFFYLFILFNIAVLQLYLRPFRLIYFFNLLFYAKFLYSSIWWSTNWLQKLLCYSLILLSMNVFRPFQLPLHYDCFDWFKNLVSEFYLWIFINSLPYFNVGQTTVLYTAIICSFLSKNSLLLLCIFTSFSYFILYFIIFL